MTPIDHDEQTFVRFVVTTVLAALAVAIILIVMVTVTGQTFGQRCSAHYLPESKAWNQCVDRLRRGGVV